MAAVGEVTLTVTVQVPFAGIVPPLKVSTPGFVALGVAVTLPPQVDDRLGNVALRRLAG